MHKFGDWFLFVVSGWLNRTILGDFIGTFASVSETTLNHIGNWDIWITACW